MVRLGAISFLEEEVIDVSEQDMTNSSKDQLIVTARHVMFLHVQAVACPTGY